jgi:hypothetical protein
MQNWGKGGVSVKEIHAAGDIITDLIPVVTATCPRRLNQPVTQDAKGAP